MVMNVQPIFHAVNSLKKKSKSSKVILLSPQGKILTHKLAKSLSKNKALILICGHYEGVDERVASLADAEISIGDYILTGGELAAMVLIDSIARFLPGVLGHKDSNREESFSSGLLEYPQYTRPANFKGLKVPAVLLSGDHQAIAKWRKNQALKRTKQKRPDILKEC
jgi:tRNA (guanine37-N1)-methyltransferase